LLWFILLNMEKNTLENKIDWHNLQRNKEIAIIMNESFDKMKKGLEYNVNPIKAQILVMSGKAKLK